MSVLGADIDAAQAAENLALVQGTPAWYQARLGKFTGSNAGKVMTKPRSGDGLSQTALTYSLELIAERLTGRATEEIRSKYLDWGNENEPIARSLYQWMLEGDRTLRQVGFWDHAEVANCGASVDCLVDDDGVLEIKCPYTVANHLKVIEAGQIQDKHYHWQCQAALWVTGRRWLDYVSFHPLVPEHMQLHVIRVERDEEAIQHLADAVVAFLEHTEARYQQICENTGGVE